MDKIVEILVTWQFALICVVTSGLIMAISNIGSKKDEKTGKRVGGLKDNVWYQRFNPLLPYVVAPLLSLIPGLMPEKMPPGWGPKILLGLAAAGFCGEVYTTVKKLIQKGGAK